MEQKFKYMVYVSCMTFNQSSYIKNALDGFCSQKTTLPYICGVIDDASTDGEQEILKRYLETNFELEINKGAKFEETDDYNLIFAQHKVNLNCYFVVILLKYNHYKLKKTKLPYFRRWRDNAKYFAMCEGDDYWIHPQKLQIQFDYMESNPKCGLIRTNIDVYYQNENRFEKEYFSHDYRLKQEDTLDFYIMYGWYAAPCTWFYRYGIEVDKVLASNKKCMIGGDISRILSILDAGYYIHYLPIVTAVYRVLSESTSHFTNPRKRYLFYEKNKRTRLHYARGKNWWFKIRFIFLNAIVARPLTMKSWTIAPLWFYDSFIKDVYYIFRKREF